MGALLVLAVGTIHASNIQVPTQWDWADQGMVLSKGPSGSWDVRLSGISPCTVVKKSSIYFLYYIGADGNRASDGGPRHRALGVATSTDGITFTKYNGNPIITFLPTPQNDQEEGVFSCGATLDEDGVVVLYYGAMTATSQTSESVNDDARLAVSSNGFDFTDLGVVIDHRHSSVWGHGDELDPLGVFHASGDWYVYYLVARGRDFSGNRLKWDLGLAWGPSRDNLPNTQAALTTGSFIRGGGAPIRLESDKIALFIVRDPSTSSSGRIVEVRTVSVSSPSQLSEPVETYAFPDFRHATVFLDRDTNTWHIYYLDSAGDTIRVKTAPMVGGIDTPSNSDK
jgi:hypothetical protein